MFTEIGEGWLARKSAAAATAKSVFAACCLRKWMRGFLARKSAAAAAAAAAQPAKSAKCDDTACGNNDLDAWCKEV